jgi:hypothetical protein
VASRRWEKKEDDALLDGVGVFSIAWFRRHVGRSYDYPNAPYRSAYAIYNRLSELIGTKSLTRGAYTLRKASLETGYTREQIKRAQSALGQKWKRLSPRGPFLITFDQLDEMSSWLKSDYWCGELKLYGCVNCGDAHRPQFSLGLCNKCFNRIYYRLKRLGLPTQRKNLLTTIQALDDSSKEVQACLRKAVTNLGRGWSVTDEQLDVIEQLIKSV